MVVEWETKSKGAGKCGGQVKPEAATGTASTL